MQAIFVTYYVTCVMLLNCCTEWRCGIENCNCLPLNWACAFVQWTHYNPLISVFQLLIWAGFTISSSIRYVFACFMPFTWKLCSIYCKISLVNYFQNNCLVRDFKISEDVKKFESRGDPVGSQVLSPGGVESILRRRDLCNRQGFSQKVPTIKKLKKGRCYANAMEWFYFNF